MKGRRFLNITMMLMIVCAATSRAQQHGEDNPPASTSATPAQGLESEQSPAVAPGTDEGGAPPKFEPMTPITGVQVLTPGPTNGGNSYLLPGFQWTGFADSNARSAPGIKSRLDSRSQYLGSLDLERLRSRSQFNLDYAGGVFFFSQDLRQPSSLPPPSFGTIHSLSANEQFFGQRWQALVGDQTLYLPESALGFSGFGGLQEFGGGFGGGSLGNNIQLNPTLTPNQSILSGNGRRLSNTANAQVQYSPGARSVLTATSTYGLLHFLDPGLIDSRYVGFVAGYNYQVTPHDELSILYTDYLFSFEVTSRAMLNRGFQLSYGHQLAGRWSLQLSAGPTATEVSQPQGGHVTRAFWTTYDSLRYRGRRGQMAFFFSRFLSSGSGVLFGAETDEARLTLNRQLTRRFSGGLDFGHTYNQSLTQQAVAGAPRRTKIELWVGGLTLNCHFRERFSLFLNGQVQLQETNTNFCFGGSCGTRTFRSVAGIGLNWHGRPVRL